MAHRTVGTTQRALAVIDRSNLPPGFRATRELRQRWWEEAASVLIAAMPACALKLVELACAAVDDPDISPAIQMRASAAVLALAGRMREQDLDSRVDALEKEAMRVCSQPR